MVYKLNINDRAALAIKNKTKRIVKLEESIPDWWGYDRV